MIDFNNASFVNMRKVDGKAFSSIIAPILIPGENVVGYYQAMRDGIVFTNKRIISINVQGITGKKKDLTSLPYSKIQAFSVESAGTLDLDSELDIWFSGLGKVRFEFVGSCDMGEICNLISSNVL